jgi:mutator protein MutT
MQNPANDDARPSYEIALALVHRAQRWLVARRHADAHLGGLWEFPGGKCMPGESPVVAALRELAEECAVRANPIAVLAPVTHAYADRIVRLTPVICRWESGEPQPLASAACRWVSATELRELDMPEATAPIIAALEAHVKTIPDSAR